MKKIRFDFSRIGTIEDFYKLAAQQLPLPDYFGKNLDALWDIITGDTALPVSIEFVNLSLQQLEKFSDLISLMHDAETALGENFTFDYYLAKSEL